MKGRWGNRGGGENAKWHTAYAHAKRAGREAVIKFLEDNPKPLIAKMKAYSESACARGVRCLAFTTGHG